MFLIEGPDNCGKTTLANKLLEWFPELRMDSRLFTGPPQGVEEYRTRCAKLGKGERYTKIYEVYDRCHYSEMVYGPIVRGYAVLPMEEFEAIDKVIMKHNPFIIYCFRSPEKILETFSEREQLEGVQERIKQIVSAYDKIMLDRQRVSNVFAYSIDMPCQVKQEVNLKAKVLSYLKTMTERKATFNTYFRRR